MYPILLHSQLSLHNHIQGQIQVFIGEEVQHISATDKNGVGKKQDWSVVLQGRGPRPPLPGSTTDICMTNLYG